ncbi:MAG: glycosyl transferase family 2 [Rhodothermaceae bacterium]|nr:MAG: glycosyl transferase family 2 [Rhodothermaceae bacterium]
MVVLIAVLHTVLFAVLLANLAHLRRHRTVRLGRGTRPTPGARPRVSVIIPARNEEANLRRLLPSLLSQRYPAFEVIVYDDASDDGTPGVLRSFAGDERLTLLRGEGPPPGWVGKVYALEQAARHARGDRLLFLDADAELADPEALERLVARYEALPGDAVLTGLTHLRGGGALLVSLVPNAILAGLPWPLARRLRRPVLGAVNGQCWMIDTATYRRLEPHRHVRAEVLEDVMIGRYLLAHGRVPTLVDVQDEVRVYMYAGLAEAWRGFRKNAYLIMGGTPFRFLATFTAFVLAYVAAPFVSPWFLLSVYLLKRITDRQTGFPPWVSLLAPLSFTLGALLQADSFASHLMGRVTWKGRNV